MFALLTMPEYFEGDLDCVNCLFKLSNLLQSKVDSIEVDRDVLSETQAQSRSSVPKASE